MNKELMFQTDVYFLVKRSITSRRKIRVKRSN